MRFEGLDQSYRNEIETFVDNRAPQKPAASVIVVTYSTDKEDFQHLLSGLAKQTVDNFEIIVVNNGNDWSVEQLLEGTDEVSLFAQLRQNCGVTFGRNLGARVARSDILIFLDDDAVPDKRFVESHCLVQEGETIGVRGRILPKTDTLYNRLQSWYDFGTESVPFLLNTEGNCSVDRDAFLSVGGFEEELAGVAGHEGIDLTYRLLQRPEYDREQIRYHPDPVIYHDMGTTLVSYIKKRTTQQYNRRRLDEQRSELDTFTDTYSPPTTGDVEPEGVELVAAYGIDGITRFWSSWRYWKHSVSEALTGRKPLSR